MWSSILVPTDFTSISDAALALAARIAAERSARIEILHVVELSGGLETQTQIRPEAAEGSVSVEQFVRERTLPRMDAQAARAGLKPGNYRCSIAFGRPADTIVREAAVQGAELIILGTRGRRGLDRWFIGSCAEAVVRRASIPVLTVPVHGEEAKLTPEEQTLRDEVTG